MLGEIDVLVGTLSFAVGLLAPPTQRTEKLVHPALKLVHPALKWVHSAQCTEKLVHPALKRVHVFNVPKNWYIRYSNWYIRHSSGYIRVCSVVRGCSTRYYSCHLFLVDTHTFFSYHTHTYVRLANTHFFLHWLPSFN
jgi:hypothetical protein